MASTSLVAVLGTIDDLKPPLQFEAQQHGIDKASQVAWISDRTRGFWRLYQECFAERAIGILYQIAFKYSRVVNNKVCPQTTS